MKLLLYIMLCMFFISCTRDSVRVNTTTTIEGDYTDTTSYMHPSGSPIAYPDTIVKKSVYKINDSTFWMMAYKCNDSLTYCGVIGLSSKFGFTIRSNNKIEVFEFAPLSTSYSAGSYYDPVKHYIYITRSPNLLDPRKEIHRMSKP